MKTFSKSILLLLFGLPLAGQQAPRIFFSDLESGPNVGGQNNRGVWVTIWGKGFGAERRRSNVTVGGGAAADYPVWSDGKITFQLGPAAKSGNIVVNLASKQASNGLPFTVRPGRIFFVAAGGGAAKSSGRQGNDRQKGTYAAPWRTIVHAKDSMSPGDTTFIEDGVVQSREDSFTAYLSMDSSGGNNSGKPNAPKALVAYPGAAATIGVAHGLEYGLRTPNIRAREDYWVISQLHIIGGRQAIDISATGWKIVGNQIECPGADGQVGCVEASQSSRIRFYGNEVHNAGTNPASSKFYHAVYFSTDSSHIDVGWNHIHDNFTCRAVQFHSSPLCSPGCGANDQTGHNQFDLHVHDNLIHGDNCNGINFATVDPSRGPVEAYNNVIYHVGARDPQGGSGAFSCIYVAGITNHGPEGTGTVEIFNNTLFDCAANNSGDTDGSRGAVSVGGGPKSLAVRLRNNIVVQLRGEIYLDGSKAQITGERNLWFGAGSAPAQTTSNLNVDPQFLDEARFDFHLRDRSPARDAGAPVLPNNPLVMGTDQPADKDGVIRPRSGAWSLGAYEAPK
ncbi:MAG TPA: IPT/TIG domain-containing protein [Candidatus Angelobacter sp.]|nr:IPT/TIG domain-containing protein [Candidatus Angelobacter sp.]